ncbi:MAG: hypothetical protein AABY10_06340 [Nanoarchaeota archaeon]
MSKFEVLNEKALAVAHSPETYSNCAGTAFYIVGLTENDRPLTMRKALKHLDEIEDVEEGSVFVMFGEGVLGTRFLRKPIHFGVVASLDPLKVHHRRGEGRAFERSVPFSEVLCIYQTSRETRFYAPVYDKELYLDCLPDA